MATPRTLFEKVWQRHLVAQRSGQCLLYVDRQYLHDVSIHAFNGLAARGFKVRRSSHDVGVPGHYVPTVGRSAADAATPEIRFMVESFARNEERSGLPSFALDDAREGSVHVIGPEQGMTQPGSLIVCGDS